MCNLLASRLFFPGCWGLPYTELMVFGSFRPVQDVAVLLMDTQGAWDAKMSKDVAGGNKKASHSCVCLGVGFRVVGVC